MVLQTNNEMLSKRICVLWFEEERMIKTEWEEVQPIPHEEDWFEKVWRDYREGKVIG